MNFEEFGAWINGKHTLYDMGFYLNERKIEVPSKIEHKIQIPGRNGEIDIDAHNGERLFKNRKITFSLSKIEKHANHQSVRANFLNEHHAKNVSFIFEDDPTWEYRGILFVKNQESDNDLLDMDVEVDCYPYKFSANKEPGQWLWDSFDFNKDYADDVYIDNQLSIYQDWMLESEGEPIVPTITVSEKIIIKVKDNTYLLEAGEYTLEEIIITDKTKIEAWGGGTISIEFTRTSL